MTPAEQTQRVSATPAAEQAITSLRAAGGPVMFVQSGGCCGGSAPMCYREGEFLTGSSDMLLGEVCGSPFYIDARLYESWGKPELVLDTEPGFAEGFSLSAGAGQHFVIRGQPAGTCSVDGC
ncbi:MAG TPA: DUF779 domain-containing protein [Streptosporangiaceae bacterium]|nr:DUF779 domain-containing protein [Streptosporangiaceae bacterium]